MPDTLIAYHQLANNWRRKRLNSPGNRCYWIFWKNDYQRDVFQHFQQSDRRTSKILGPNENNEYGVPKTILRSPENTEVLIVEMGMRGSGRNRFLVSYCQSQYRRHCSECRFCSFGTSLGSLENIAAAKCELLANLDSSGIAILGQNSDLLKRLAQSVFDGRILVFDDDQIRIITTNETSTIFEVNEFDCRFEIRAHGKAQLADAWCAIQAARTAGLNDEEIASGLRTFHALEGRGLNLRTSGGALIIDDSYNANPDSMRASVEIFVDPQIYPQPRKFIVLGELKELGPEGS